MIEFLRWAHVIGATVLLGTGAGIAFFMVMAHRTGRIEIIAHTSGVVVIADWLFTASAVVLQPITGVLLAHYIGWSLMEGWVIISLGLYVMVGLFWLPVVWMQHQMHTLAKQAEATGGELPQRYHQLFRLWFVSGFPAFAGVLAIVWLMVTKPSFGFSL